MRIAVIGGTGEHGGGLAVRWARAGFELIIGSREARKAAAAAVDLKAKVPGAQINGRANERALAEADFAVLAVPCEAHRSTVEGLKTYLRGAVVIDTCVGMEPDRPGLLKLPPEGSTLQETMHLLGPGSRVVAAFQNIPAGLLWDLERGVSADVLVCGDDEEAKQLAMTLATSAGMRALDAGPASNARLVEATAALMDVINRRYSRSDMALQFAAG
ncbi:MAG: NADPH-dependent F420 reductase [Armatimonadota bacterium]